LRVIASELSHLPENSPELRAAHFNLQYPHRSRPAGFPAALSFVAG
jgi:hypothetical protein